MSANRRLSLLVVAFALVFPTLITWLYFVALRESSPTVQQVAYTLTKAIQFGLPVVWVLSVNREALRVRRPTPSGIWLGLAFGVLIGMSMWGLYALVLQPAGFFAGPVEQVKTKVIGLGLDTPAKYAAVGLFYALCHSLLEEYYWRWFVFRELRGVSSLGTAVLVSSLGFMAHHILVLATFFGWSSPATWIFSASVAIGGAFWAWLYERSQSLLGPWFSHCLVDTAIFMIGFDLVREVFQ